MKRHHGPATWESKVRGLMIGLALGDAIGSKRSHIPESGMLEAGAATQLAAWTVEGLLRSYTRSAWAIGGSNSCVLYAYQRWVMLRGGLPSTSDWEPVPEVEGKAQRGWLLDVPAMAENRGSSPSTMKAVLSGKPTQSQGCQALLRGLPYAALAGPAGRGGVQIVGPEKLAHYARQIAELTHQHPRGGAAVQLSTAISASCLREQSIVAGIRSGTELVVSNEVNTQMVRASQAGLNSPCVPQTLEQLAPDKTAASALAGGIYVAMSFPEVDTVAEALEFAGWAPDGDSVGAVAGAFLGAVHGYESLPAALTSRLELGWVMDRLAVDLARQAVENQAGSGWKSEDPEPEPPADPWWDTKYPGI